MDIKKLVQEYLDDNKHMQLATVKDGQPWLCTVYFTSDEAFNLYWTSGRSRQHSLEILSNPKAAVTVVRDTERKQALQITGEAHEVADDDFERVHGLYTKKFGPKDYDLEEMRKHNPEGRSYWVFRPTSISIWDEVNFPDSPKQRFEME
ncbi:MAG: pyridoxamine 5'-phosphate oxidase family protein [Candidatus Saccharibacteria bacterium]